MVVLLVVAVAVAAGTAPTAGWRYSPVLGWDAGALVFGCRVWATVATMDAATTATHATREDPSRGQSDLLVLAAAVAAAVASLAGVGVLLFGAGSARGSTKDLLAGLGLVSVAVSWLTVHMLSTLRYDLLYYAGPDGGIDFNQTEPPSHTDFAYVACTLGMTYQVSDTDLSSHAIRVTALRQSLLSYLFGAVVPTCSGRSSWPRRPTSSSACPAPAEEATRCPARPAELDRRSRRVLVSVGDDRRSSATTVPAAASFPRTAWPPGRLPVLQAPAVRLSPRRAAGPAGSGRARPRR